MSTWQQRLRSLGTLGRTPAGASVAEDGPLLDEDLLREINRLGLESQGAVTEWLTGEHEGLRKTQALEFADYRGYVAGDDFRLIDWNAYARLGELFVKTSTAPETVTLSLLLDCSRSMDWGRPNTLRYSKRLAAAIGAVGLLRSDRVRLFALGDGMAHSGPTFQGPTSLLNLALALENVSVAARTDLASSIAAFRRVADPQGVVVVLSDLLVPFEQVDVLGDLAAAGASAVVLHIVNEAEATPKLHGSVELRDSESGERARLTITPALRHRYMRMFEARSHALAERCAAVHVRYVRVSTSVAPIDLLTGMFREERVVRA